MFKETANNLHKKGYNCAQSVLCAFASELDIDEKLLFKLTEGFGAGMGNRQGPCGALSAVVAIAGLVNSDGNINNPTSKTSTYNLTADIVKEFENNIFDINCCDIKNKKKHSCDECISVAVDIAQNIIKRSKS